MTDLSQDINNSQLLCAHLVYILFASEECPINYNMGDDYWHVWDRRWITSGMTMTKVKLYFQTDLLKCMREVYIKMKGGDAQGAAQQENARVDLIKKLVEQLESREALEQIPKEAIFLSPRRMI